MKKGGEEWEEETNSVHALSAGFDNDSLIFGIFYQDVVILQSFGGHQKGKTKGRRMMKKEEGIKQF